MRALGDILLVIAISSVGGLFAMAEIALVSLRESQVKALSERGRRGQKLAKLVADPNRFLAAVQVGVTLMALLSATFGAATLIQPLAGWVERHGVGPRLADAAAFAAVTIMVSFVSLLLGELAPKRLGLQRAERVALVAAGPLDWLASVFRPVIWLLSVTTNEVVRLLGGDPRANREAITEEELRGLVAAHESLSRDERKLIDDVFAAGERQVREVMVPRTEVDFLEAATTVRRAAKIAMERPHSRYPVVGRHSDDVIGFVHIRDLLDPDVPGGRAATVSDLAREVARLPGTKKVLAALSEMRREGHHLAIVIDEYGGTDGIVTLEDLIEEVIGDIRDEYDVGPGEGPTWPGGEVEVDGLLNLNDFAEQTGRRLQEGPYETAAGYVMARLGRLPALGDTVDVDGWTLTVTALDGRRVARLRVTPPREQSATAAGEPAAGEPGGPPGAQAGSQAQSGGKDGGRPGSPAGAGAHAGGQAQAGSPAGAGVQAGGRPGGEGGADAGGHPGRGPGPAVRPSGPGQPADVSGDPARVSRR